MQVVSVSQDGQHRFSKQVTPSIQLLAGLGVQGDAHAGTKVKHRSRVRQIRLIHAELLDELAGKGFTVQPGDLGENLLTRGLDLLGLPSGTRLRLGPDALVEITGLRNPCAQIEHFQPGLLKAVLDEDEHGHLIRKAGIMGIVLSGGEVKAGDAIHVELPPPLHRRLEQV